MYTLEQCNSLYEFVKTKILSSYQYMQSTDWVYWVTYAYHLFFHSIRKIATRKRTALTERQLFYVGKQGETFIHDENMPSLPLASLDDALNMYLDSVKPLVLEEEFLKTEEIVTKFKEGVGKELYEKLYEKSQTEKNWLEQWWLEQAYLNIRFPLIPYLNMSGCTPIEGFNVPNYDQWLDHAALHIYFQLQFWKLIRREKLRPFINRGQPWSMNQLKNLFNTTRIPKENKDELRTYFKTESDGPCGPKHIAVCCRGHIFTFKALDENEEPLTAPEIAWNLEQIHNWCENHEEGPYVGALTSTNRDVWAKNRQALMDIDVNNKTCLEDIDTAIQMIVLDNQEPQNDNEMQRFTLCAEKLDRWADKSLTTFVFRNGCMSGSSDHAPYDGMVSMTISHYIQISLKAYGGEWQGTKKIRELPKPSRLPFNLDENLLNEIEKAKQQYQALCLNLQTKYSQFTTYGKAFIKPYNIRPEAYVQLSLQLAYNRLHGKPAPTYMTASTRQFYHGRTETCRTCTSECLEWVKAMDNPDFSVAEKVRLMYGAVDKMNSLLTKCMKGSGCDRLLLGLSCLSEELNMETPEIFTDPSYKKSGGGGNFILSTSCTGYTPMAGSVAPMCLEGYGTFYSIENNRIGFQMTAYNMYPETDTEKYYNSIENALKDMQNLLMASKL